MALAMLVAHGGIVVATAGCSRQRFFFFLCFSVFLLLPASFLVFIFSSAFSFCSPPFSISLFLGFFSYVLCSLSLLSLFLFVFLSLIFCSILIMPLSSQNNSPSVFFCSSVNLPHTPFLSKDLLYFSSSSKTLLCFSTLKTNIPYNLLPCPSVLSGFKNNLLVFLISVFFRLFLSFFVFSSFSSL